MIIIITKKNNETVYVKYYAYVSNLDRFVK